MVHTPKALPPSVHAAKPMAPQLPFEQKRCPAASALRAAAALEEEKHFLFLSFFSIGEKGEAIAAPVSYTHLTLPTKA